MAIDAELKARIEADAQALKPGELMRPGMSFDDFVEQFSRKLAQARRDKEMLVAAGFPFDEVMPYNEGLLEMLGLLRGERVSMEGVKDGIGAEFDKKFPRAELHRKVMLKILQHVTQEVNDPDLASAYRWIRDGRSQMDTLNDNLALVPALKKIPELREKYRPGGTLVDETYLGEALDHAVELQKLLGEARSAQGDIARYLDKLNRVITLCKLAEKEICKYADLAFFDNHEHYDRYYASDAQRQYRTQSGGDESSGPDQDEQHGSHEAPAA